MAKNIVIALLAVLTLTSFTYAYYQRTLTQKALTLAEANAEQARVAEREAMAQRELAQDQMALALLRAEKARVEAELALNRAAKK